MGMVIRGNVGVESGMSTSLKNAGSVEIRGGRKDESKKEERNFESQTG